MSPVSLGHLGRDSELSACQHFLVLLPEKGAQRTLDLHQLWLGYVPQMEEEARPSPKQMAEPGLTSHGLETGP